MILTVSMISMISIYILKYRKRCESLCTSRGGHLNNITLTCHIDKYLNNICIRLRPSDNTWDIDNNKYLYY